MVDYYDPIHDILTVLLKAIAFRAKRLFRRRRKSSPDTAWIGELFQLTTRDLEPMVRKHLTSKDDH